MLRPVDVQVADRDGRPVTGLSGHLVAVRPADTRLNQRGELVALPYAGRYRTLMRLDAAGAWELRLDVRQHAMRFVHAARFTVPHPNTSAAAGASR
jgi:nitrogen fixation protein FixH